MPSIVVRHRRGMRRYLYPFVPYLTPRTVGVLAGGAALFVLGAGLFTYSLIHPSKSDASIFSLLHEAGTTEERVDTVATKTAATLGMTIANNGLVYVKNATITSVSNKTLFVSISWGKADFPWTVETTYVTQFLRKDGTRGTLADFKAGDRVSVSGMLVSSSTEPLLRAKSVRLSAA